MKVPIINNVLKVYLAIYILVFLYSILLGLPSLFLTLKFWGFFDLIFGIIALLGITVYIFKIKVFHNLFWQIFTPLFIIWDLLFNYYIEPSLSQRVELVLWLEILINLVFILPTYILLSFYSFKFLISSNTKRNGTPEQIKTIKLSDPLYITGVTLIVLFPVYHFFFSKLLLNTQFFYLTVHLPFFLWGATSLCIARFVLYKTWKSSILFGLIIIPIVFIFNVIINFFLFSLRLPFLKLL